MKTRCVRLMALGALALTTACVKPAESERASFLPVMRWDHRPEATEWTAATLAALQSEGAVLASTIPMDVDTFCPKYEEASLSDRQAFWAGLFSAIAKYESTWNPAASGGGGRYIGLLQISPATANYAGCDLADGGLTDGATNLACAVKIAARRAPDGGGVVTGPGALAGLVNDWGPMHDSSKRAEMAAWTRAQPYCN